MVERNVEDRKLKKVVMEYDNGDIEYIEGDDVERWQNAINSAIVLAYVHGSSTQDVLKDIVWKKY